MNKIEGRSFTSNHVKLLKHLDKLKLIQDNYYNSPEFWINSIKGKYKSLWNSGKIHCYDSYPPHIYENKNITPFLI